MSNENNTVEKIVVGETTIDEAIKELLPNNWVDICAEDDKASKRFLVNALAEMLPILQSINLSMNNVTRFLSIVGLEKFKHVLGAVEIMDDEVAVAEQIADC